MNELEAKVDYLLNIINKHEALIEMLLERIEKLEEIQRSFNG